VRRHWRAWLLALAGGVILLALLAPGVVGRAVAGLWVAVMGAVVGLIDGLIG
jgi:hypothetical protein